METPERTRHALDGHTVLLVEDNEDEVFIMQRAFRKAKISNPLQVAIDGEEALEYLEGRGKFTDRATYHFPVVVFLDLNMPKKGGFEVLEYVRKDPKLKSLTIYVLSSSTRPADIEHAAELGANEYFIKPTQLEALQQLVENWYRLAGFAAFPIRK